MEKKPNDTQFLTLVLTITGGYSDALTYVAANKIFSNHITGNIVLFADNLITGKFSGACASLLAIPVFIFSVLTGGWIIKKYSNRNLFFFEGILFLSGGILAYIFGLSNFEEMTVLKYWVAMLSVSAMGMQSTFGKRFAKDTYGLTTLMTGNIVQLSLQVESYPQSGLKKAQLLISMARGSITICGFITGCILGAYSGQHYGLVGMMLPGIMILLIFSLKKSFRGLPNPIV
ncbi:YoaK family protein [Mucilaginibacter sabulilitoris]|uniref:YoaK family protein n=1 Tax=Mucilaginibacter sabulilitoris TaxID=1173583 RepID=A0ABZ0TEH4_9SPHI|nr:YoaK family protein [Mucilaginibacter sabulilitoris]WPU91592.1 YoaK family protein [Mucilaginibacter sabulilitoris]